MLRLPFEQLTDERFEELCYQALPELGFVNVRWRSPGGDGGRDLEADVFHEDAAGHITRERWWIECKRYTSGVPRDKIEPAYSAAAFERIDYFLVIASSYLTNDCLNHLDRRAESGQPPRVRVWTGHDLTRPKSSDNKEAEARSRAAPRDGARPHSSLGLVAVSQDFGAYSLSKLRWRLAEA